MMRRQEAAIACTAVATLLLASRAGNTPMQAESTAPVASLTWSAGRDPDVELHCVVDGKGALSVERLGGDGKELLRFAPGAGFLSMFPTRVSGGNLVTTWVGGTALHIYVFRYDAGRVLQVLDAGSRALPELVYLAHDAEPTLITSTEAWFEGGAPKIAGKAEVFRWQDGAYRPVLNVPWATRLGPLAEIAAKERR